MGQEMVSPTFYGLQMRKRRKSVLFFQRFIFNFLSSPAVIGIPAVLKDGAGQWVR
jgi:hypothetical protein